MPTKAKSSAMLEKINALIDKQLALLNVDWFSVPGKYHLQEAMTIHYFIDAERMTEHDDQTVKRRVELELADGLKRLQLLSGLRFVELFMINPQATTHALVGHDWRNAEDGALASVCQLISLSFLVSHYAECGSNDPYHLYLGGVDVHDPMVILPYCSAYLMFAERFRDPGFSMHEPNDRKLAPFVVPYMNRCTTIYHTPFGYFCTAIDFEEERQRCFEMYRAVAMRLSELVQQLIGQPRIAEYYIAAVSAYLLRTQRTPGWIYDAPINGDQYISLYETACRVLQSKKIDFQGFVWDEVRQSWSWPINQSTV